MTMGDQFFQPRQDYNKAMHRMLFSIMLYIATLVVTIGFGYFSIQLAVIQEVLITNITCTIMVIEMIIFVITMQKRVNILNELKDKISSEE